MRRMSRRCFPKRFLAPRLCQKKDANCPAQRGYKLSKGWTAALTASAAATPYMESKVDVMAKLAYNQVYRVREVR